MKINPILDEKVEAEIDAALENESPALEGINAQLDRIFRDPALKFGLKFFQNGERAKLRLRENGTNLEIYCLNRKKWLRAKPEEVVRQLFLVYVRDSLFYPMERVGVEWPMQMGEDAEKERADIVIFSDDARTDPYIVFELKRPSSQIGLDQLRSYLRWTSSPFGCWSNGSEHTFQLREETAAGKGAYTFRDIPRLPAQNQTLEDILQPLTFAELVPISNMRALIQRLEHDALANAGVNAFDELFKLFFAKLHDEYRPRIKPTDAVDFRVPTGTPEDVYARFNSLFAEARSRKNWDNIFDKGEQLKLKGEALRLCATALRYGFALRLCATALRYGFALRLCATGNTS